MRIRKYEKESNLGKKGEVWSIIINKYIYNYYSFLLTTLDAIGIIFHGGLVVIIFNDTILKNNAKAIT